MRSLLRRRRLTVDFGADLVRVRLHCERIGPRGREILRPELQDRCEFEFFGYMRWSPPADPDLAGAASIELRLIDVSFA